MPEKKKECWIEALREYIRAEIELAITEHCITDHCNGLHGGGWGGLRIAADKAYIELLACVKEREK